jgi:hypothetical protein
MRIFGHSTVHLDLECLEFKEFKDLELKDLKDLELSKLMDLTLNI